MSKFASVSVTTPSEPARAASGAGSAAGRGDSGPKLVVCTALSARPGRRDGSFVLTRKFIEGVREYVRHWPGRVSVWVERAAQPGNNLDHSEVHPGELPFDVRWIEGDEGDDDRFAAAVESADLVLAALVDKHVCLAGQCRRRGVPLVYVTEYSERTRQQIIRAETRNPIVRLRRERWNRWLERQYRAALALAAGVQCNGTPTHCAYQSLTPRALLYFDTRVRAEQLVAAPVLRQRLTALRKGGPLRLAFSGRLIAMKGADHLPHVARELRRLAVPFTLDVCGGGALEPAMRRDIARFSLGDHVHMRGVLDFERQLLPLIAREIDLFVCCHRQGDPSCTYLETYSCGVPIVGYGNEALGGLVSASNVGGPDWTTPLGDPVTLAAKIADLNRNRELIAAASDNALAFAAQHTFEQTMQRRVQHMLECLRHAQAPSSPASRPQTVSS